MCKPTEIILVNPSNTIRERQKTFVRAIYPNLGLLQLGTSLSKKLNGSFDHKVIYFDGALHGDDLIYNYLSNLSCQKQVILCLSSYTYNYEGCIRLADFAKNVHKDVTVIIGNDHFSALYERIMKRQASIDFGFCGNDVVEGFVDFVFDLVHGKQCSLPHYAGLVYREPGSSHVRRNSENPNEYQRLPLVDYSLADSLYPHSQEYLAEQRLNYSYVKDNDLRVTVIDIARGCIKFSGKRTGEIPDNACSFCAIIPGSTALLSKSAARAWEIIKNAYDQGYNYYFTSADELPLTFWPMLKEMAQNQPRWLIKLPFSERPKILCYARADGFQKETAARLDILMNKIGIDHFNIGLDSFTQTSLMAMNKGLKNSNLEDLPGNNINACKEIFIRNGKITAGFVITHLGITSEMLEQNYRAFERLISNNHKLFIEIGFELLCPLPGSHSFNYMCYPSVALSKARSLGLKVDTKFLTEISEKYLNNDVFDGEELVQDFIHGCCPEISIDIAYDYLGKIRRLVERYDIVWESTSPA